MAGCRELSENVASLTFDGSTSGEEPLVRNWPGATNDNSTERVDMEPRKPLLAEYPTSLTFSSHPKTTIIEMCLTASNKLWVKYNPPGAYMNYLKLFGENGKELGLWRGRVIPEGLSLTCVEDTLLSLESWRWIKPSGDSGCLDNAPNKWARCSKSISPPYVILSCVTSDENDDEHYDKNYGEREYTLHRLEVLSVDPLKLELVAVCQETFSTYPDPSGFDVSSCGTMFCVLRDQFVEIFYINGPLNSLTITKLVEGNQSNIQRFTALGKLTSICFNDACFYSEHGRDMLIASAVCRYTLSNQISFGKTRVETNTAVVLFLDHDDGFCVKRNIPTTQLCTKITAHGPGGRLWLGYDGGRIEIVNLS